MFKISWGRKSDKFHQTFVIVPDAHALSEAWHIITGYGRNDGLAPHCVKVTNLDGHEIDMSKGLPNAAAMGTYSTRSM